MTSRPRLLAIIPRYPLPAHNGGLLRMWNLLAAAADVADGDLVVLAERDAEAIALVEQRLAGWDVHAVPVPPRPYSVRRRLRWVVRREAPTWLALRDLGPARRLVVDLLRAHPAALYTDRQGFVVSEALTDLPIIVDVDDDEEVKLRRTLAVSGLDEFDSRVRRAWKHVSLSVDMNCWRRLHVRLGRRPAAALFAAEVDARRLASPVARVVPNGTDIEAVRRPDAPTGRPPTLLFLGDLNYGPNVDAVQVLVRKVMPAVVSRRPDVQLRLVGRARARIEAIASGRPNIELTGWVRDIGAELARADVCVVPLRIGSGTRIKILDAFAAGVPVVATRIGAEGLDVADGTHLLLADEPGAFADAVLRVLADPGLRRDLVTAAGALVDERYRWAEIRRSMSRLVSDIVAPPAA